MSSVVYLSLLSSLPDWSYCYVLLYPAFYVAAIDDTQVLILMWQAAYTLAVYTIFSYDILDFLDSLPCT